MRKRSIALVLVLSANLAWTPPNASPVAAKQNLAAQALAFMVADADLTGLTFEEFTEWIPRATSANVVVRWRILEDAGVDRSHELAIKKKDMALHDLLLAVFQQVTGEIPGAELAAQADENTLIISTRADINNRRVTRTYDIQDLMLSVPNFESSAIKALGIGEDEGFRLSGSAARLRREREAHAAVRPLIDFVTAQIAPLSWKVNGGKGTIRYFKGRLVVHNSIEVHLILCGALDVNERSMADGAQQAHTSH